MTGWKCLFPIGYNFASGGVEGVSQREDQILKEYGEYCPLSFLDPLLSFANHQSAANRR